MHPGNRLHGYESVSGCTVAANSGLTVDSLADILSIYEAARANWLLANPGGLPIVYGDIWSTDPVTPLDADIATIKRAISEIESAVAIANTLFAMAEATTGRVHGRVDVHQVDITDPRWAPMIENAGAIKAVLTDIAIILATEGLARLPTAAATGGAVTARGPLHHIATNKNGISTAGGGPFTPKFEALFQKAGMTLEHARNKIRVLGHRGPHPEYNRIVYERLSARVEGLQGAAYRAALLDELRVVAIESVTPGSALNVLLTGAK